MTSLFTIFVVKFAVPSFMKFVNSGTVNDKSWRQKTEEDFPSVTFCALNNKTLMGWKNKEFRMEIGQSFIESNCGNETTLKDTVDCIEKKTYNLTETIMTYNEDVKSIRADDTLWIHHIFDTAFGNVLIN